MKTNVKNKETDDQINNFQRIVMDGLKCKKGLAYKSQMVCSLQVHFLPYPVPRPLRQPSPHFMAILQQSRLFHSSVPSLCALHILCRGNIEGSLAKVTLIYASLIDDFLSPTTISNSRQNLPLSSLCHSCEPCSFPCLHAMRLSDSS